MIHAVICDDEDAALKIITYSIEKQGIPIEIVGTASDGQEALALIKRKKPNLVFLDIEMPGMNGFEVIEKLSSLNCKIIIITAYSTFTYAQRALRLGVSDIIAKPIDTDTLKQAIQRAIGWAFTGNEALNKALFYIHIYALSGKGGIRNAGGGSLLYAKPTFSFISKSYGYLFYDIFA